jgi:peroxiredoxin
LLLLTLTQIPWSSKTSAETVTAPLKVKNLEGKEVDLNKLIAGKPTLLIFWATWCPACRAEVPDFAGAYHRYASKGLQVLAVDVGYNDPIEEVRQFARARALPYTVLYDETQAAVRAFGVQGTPTVLLLDASGAVIHRGYAINDAAVGKLLAGAGPSAAPGGPADPRPVETKLNAMAEMSRAKMPAEVRGGVTKGIEELAASGITGRALQVGQAMPAFSLEDAHGKSVHSRDLLKKGPLVIVFYRGAWCPFCNLYLSSLQGFLPQFSAHGASLVAISPETPDKSLTVEEKGALKFEVLSDPGLKVARKFGIVFQLPQVMDAAYRKMGLDIKGYYKTPKAELPLSATYVVDRAGKVVYAFLDPDYKHRAEPADILAALEKAGGGRKPAG